MGKGSILAVCGVEQDGNHMSLTRFLPLEGTLHLDARTVVGSQKVGGF
jgi:hypothetical protein